MIRIVALAGSAGGLEALRRILAGLPAKFPVPILVMLHLEPDRESKLAEILGRATELDVVQAEDAHEVQAGRVYVARPGRHLTVRDGSITLNDDPPEHFVRPSADQLFRSVAEAYGRHGLVVVLTGGGSDGAEGALAVHEAGGVVFVQDADEATQPSMPTAAIGTGAAGRILRLDEIPPALLDATAGDAGS